MTARPKVPLPLLAVVKSFLDTLVVTRPFAGAPVYGILLTHAERLRVVDCGLKGRLVRMLSLGVGRHFEPQRNRRACHQMM